MDNKKNHQSDDKDTSLIISSRRASSYMATAVFVLVGVFGLGYFFGKTSLLEESITCIEENSFADQVYASLCALYDHETLDQYDNSDESNENTFLAADGSSQDVRQGTAQVVDLSSDSDMVIQHEQASQKFYAQLIGFSKKNAAHAYVAKLQKNGWPVILKSRSSVTAKGSKKVWYQVVTEPFSDKQELDTLVTRIAHKEHIRDIRICSL